MPRDRVALIRQLAEALNAADWSAILPHLSSDVVLDATRARGEIQGMFHGPSEVRRSWESPNDVWDTLRIELDDPTEIGDQVVVPVSAHARGRQEIELTARAAWIFTFRGEKVSKISIYQDEHDALRAARDRE